MIESHFERGVICRQFLVRGGLKPILTIQATVLALWVVIRLDLGLKESNLHRGAIYRQFLVKEASSPLCASNPSGLVRVCFWLCRQVLLLAVSLGFGH